MKKRMKGRIFSRKRGPRKALLLSVARALVQKEKIQTTEAKAKAVSPLVEQLIGKAKHNDLQARRHILRYLDKTLTKKMIEEIAPRYEQRRGGYTRIIKIAPRKSDGARMAIVELVA